MDIFESVIDRRLRQGCNGIRLMLGYETALGQGVFYNCLAGMDMTQGMMRLASTLFVDVPLYRCLCVQAAGQDYLPYVYAHCTSLIPSTRKAFWQNTLAAANSAGGGGLPSMCAAYLDGIEEQALNAFDDWARDSQQSATIIASVFDEIFVPQVLKIYILCFAVMYNYYAITNNYKYTNRPMLEDVQMWYPIQQPLYLHLYPLTIIKSVVRHHSVFNAAVTQLQFSMLNCNA